MVGILKIPIMFFIYMKIVDLRSGRTLSCGRAPSLLVASLLRGLGCLAFPAGVAALHSNQLISLNSGRYIDFYNKRLIRL